MKLFTKDALESIVGGEEYGAGLGFGCMGITAFYGDSMEDDKALELLQAVYDGGCRHFDTAEAYKQKGKYNETILGEFFKTVPRNTFTVATKYSPLGVSEEIVYEYDDVKRALTGSLERLQLDYVDLYYAHRVISLEGGLKFAATAKRLKEEGLIKEIGLSEVTGKWLKQINEICPIDAVQQEWSLMTRNLEEELIPVCKELGTAVVAYSPLSRNLLATKVDTTPSDWRGGLPRYSRENLDKNQAIVNQVYELAKKNECTAAELSLAWLFHKAYELGVCVIPIPGTTKLLNAKSNMGSAKIKISNEDMLALESLVKQVCGARGNEWYLANGIESQK